MHGFVDMGANIDNCDGDNLVHAKNAFLFMAVGINGQWKMPLGYFLIGGLNGNERSNLLSNCLQLIHVCVCAVIRLCCAVHNLYYYLSVISYYIYYFINYLFYHYFLSSTMQDQLDSILKSVNEVKST